MIELGLKHQLLNNMKTLTNYIEDFKPMESCLDCGHWDGKRDRCKKFDMVPPPKVIVKKCDEFIPDIPF